MQTSNKLEILVGEFAFEFSSYDDWVHKGSSIWRRHGLDNGRGICIDAKGRIVEMGHHFARATADGAYPVKVYRKQIAPAPEFATALSAEQE